mmetsp:Transcript_60022/g.131913  ORF Transcript_60022/g.131913 Transcript_60022/m.131913 type:complete len:190 (-) Transcript_60022:46-615(-)
MMTQTHTTAVVSSFASTTAQLLEEAAEEAAEGAALLASLERRRRRTAAAHARLAELGDLGRSRLFYKAVARVRPSSTAGRRLVSVFDGATEYRLGIRTGEAPPDTTTGAAVGGPRYFAYATVQEAMRCPFPRTSHLAGHGGAARAPVVVLLVQGLGEPEYHGRGKFSFSQLLPVATVPGVTWQDEGRWR